MSDAAANPIDDAGRQPEGRPGAPASTDADLAEDVELVVPDSGATGRRAWLGAAAALLALVSLAGPLRASGIWDPPELQVAELARRIALNLLGAADLVVEGANNTVPTQGELARGQLPFQSVAVGFKLFGLTEWGGRLPLVLWGLAGIVAVWLLVVRLADRAAAAFSVVVLSTTPLYFLHARTMLGEIVTMATLAIATSGMALATFDRGSADRPSHASLRVLAFVVGCAALAAAGFGARGLLVGVAVPSLAVGLAWVLVRAAADQRSDKVGTAFGLAALTIGLGAAVVGGRAYAQATAAEYSWLVGAAIVEKRQLPTFDVVIGNLAHGMFPWSAVVPFAAGRILRPPVGREGVELEREAALRAVLLLVAALGLAAYAATLPRTGAMAFGPVFALAAVVGLALRDFERGAAGSMVAGMGVVAFAILLYTDFKNFPEKSLVPFSVEGGTFPESFKALGTKIVKYGAIAASAAFLLSILERQRDAPEGLFERDRLLAWPRALRTAFGGNLLFGYLVVSAALIGFSALSFVSQKWFHWKQFEAMSPIAGVIARYGWAAFPVGVVAAPPLVVVGLDAVRFFYRVVPISRGFGALLSVAALGAVMSLWYYPALATQISPRDVFVRYRQLASTGEALAMMGTGAGSARYYAGREVPSHATVPAAFNWLMEAPGERRWLVIRSKDLPQMNSLFRERMQPRRNLPVLDARSSEILLVSNQLAEGETSQNPFAPWFPDEPIEPANRAEGNFGNQLEVLGWEVRDVGGRVVDAVRPGVAYDFLIHYRVQAKISGNWETFVHIDGFQRRFNGDHPTLEGKYPFHLWLPGDQVVDSHRFTLEPNFTPGDYRVFFGLFIGSRRLEVKRGRHSEDRLDVGTLRVN